MALCFRVMIDIFGRPSETLWIETKHVLRQVRGVPRAAVLLHPEWQHRSSKTGESNESLVLDRPWRSKALVAHVVKRRPGSMLWDGTLKELRHQYMDAAHLMGLRDLNPSLYQMRHAGASLAISWKRHDLQRVQKRGRWRAAQHVRRYEKSTFLQDSLLKVFSVVCRWAHSCAEVIQQFICQGAPPIAGPCGVDSSLKSYQGPSGLPRRLGRTATR